MVFRKLVMAASVALAMGAAQAQISDGVVKIGLLVDMTGPYSQTTGIGSSFPILQLQD